MVVGPIVGSAGSHRHQQLYVHAASAVPGTHGDDSALYRPQVAHHALDLFRRLGVRDLVIGIFSEKLVPPHWHVPGAMSAQVRLPIDYPVDLICWKSSATLRDEGQVGYWHIEDGRYRPIAGRAEAVTAGARNTELPLPAFDGPRVLWRCIMAPTHYLVSRATGERCNGKRCKYSCDDFQDSSVVRGMFAAIQPHDIGETPHLTGTLRMPLRAAANPARVRYRSKICPG